MRRSVKGELKFSENEENSYFEYEKENSDADDLGLCDDITMNKMRGKDIMAKKAAAYPNEIYRIEEESIVTGGMDTPNLMNTPTYLKESREI